MKDADLLKAYGHILPSRGELKRMALYGTSEEQRATANQLLQLLPKKVDPSGEWADNPWNPENMPTLEEMKLSPAGRITLELIASRQPEVSEGADDPMKAGPDKLPTDAAEVAIPKPEPPPAMPPDDGVNDYLKRLDWPPQPSQPMVQPPVPYINFDNNDPLE